MAVCTDCGDKDAECLTAERVRVCTSCLYERAARERDALRELLSDTFSALTGATTRVPSAEHLACLPSVARELREEVARIHRLAPMGLYTVSAPHEEEILRLREEVTRCHDSLREADRVLRQAYAERDALIGAGCSPEQNALALLDLYHLRATRAEAERDEARAEVESCHLYGLVTDEHAALADALGLRDGKHIAASIARHARAEIERLLAALEAK